MEYPESPLQSLVEDADVNVPFDATFLIAFRMAFTTNDAAQKVRCLRKLHLSEEQLRAFEPLRARYQSISSDKHISKTDRIIAGLAVWREVWEKLEEFFHSQTGFALYIPPIYTDDTNLHNMLSNIFFQYWRREAFDGRHETGHVVIAGAEGTGKTTIVKAVAIASAICSPSMFLLFVSYEEGQRITRFSSLARLFRELYYRFALCDLDGNFGAKEADSASPTLVAKLNNITTAVYGLRISFNLRVGVVADEIQEVFKLELSTIKERQALMADLQWFARNTASSFIVLTGSFAILRWCLVGHEREPGFEGFPDFNKDLCDFYSISALRTVTGLQNYYKTRYKEELTEHQARELLYQTGGIGRWVDDYRRHKNSQRTAVSLKLEMLFQKYPTLQAVIQYIREYQLSAHGRDLAVCSRGKEILLPSDVSVPWDTLVSDFSINGRVAAFTLTLPDIDRWADCGLLYLNWQEGSPTTVQLAIPADAVIHYATSNVHARDYRRVMFSWEMVHGMGEFLGAGLHFEALMRPRINSLLPSASAAAAAEAEDAALMITGAALCMCVADSPPLPVAVANLNLLCQRTWAWKNEVGLDAVQFEHYPTDRVITISGVQFKGGRLASKRPLAGGTVEEQWEKVAASVRKFPTDILENLWELLASDEYNEVAPKAKVENVGNNVAGYIVKAAVGFSRLALALLSALPGYSVHIGRFVLATTKRDGSEKRALKTMSSTWKPPQELAGWLGFESSLWDRCNWDGFTKSKILKTTDEWILEHLEPELKIFWKRSRHPLTEDSPIAAGAGVRSGVSE